MKNLKESINEMLENLSTEEIEEGNRQIKENSEREFNDFVENYKKGKCHICKKSFKTFSKEKPCLHYLLRTSNNFKNKDFKKIHEKWGYFNISSYLRWIANQEKFIGNINNLDDEKGESKKFEYSIKRKHIKWTFSCDQSDFKGHQGKYANFPHYHFQMTINGKSFINFGQTHVPFKDEDLFNFEIIKNKNFNHGWGDGGYGIQDFLDELETLKEDDLDNVLKEMIYKESEENSQLNIQTFVSGKMNGNDILKLLEESKKGGKTMNTLMKEKYPNHEIQTIINPSDSITEIENRTIIKKKGRPNTQTTPSNPPSSNSE